MHAERKQLWIDALRSGEYVQARGSFSVREEEVDDDGSRLQQKDCCLSVLTRVAIANGLDTVRYGDYGDSALDPTPQVLIEARDMDPDADDVAEWNSDGSAWVWHTDGDLPEPVTEWIGVIGATNPILDGIAAIDRNDSRCQSFEEIAKAIEATP